jgi:hypothetical protein
MRMGLRCVMDWKKERDLLIAQTLAFVQSVAGKKAGAEATTDEIPDTEPHVEAAATEIREIFERPAFQRSAVEPLVTEPPKDGQISADIPRVLVTNDFRTEIEARVVSFRAHQQRFDREREEYFSATLGKARATVRNETTPPPSRRPADC